MNETIPPENGPSAEEQSRGPPLLLADEGPLPPPTRHTSRLISPRTR